MNLNSNIKYNFLICHKCSLLNLAENIKVAHHTNPLPDKPEGPLHAYETSNPEQTLNHKGMRRVGMLRTY